ncbi:MAG: TRAP transporter large permease subunit [Enterocloster sp.]|uniref:TRAP transporter large permease subunit n=1 Tax=Enterocloster sp. TaxID=2719315 RepID=UPI00399C248B
MTMSVVQVGLILIGTFFLLLALSVPVSISLIVSSVLTTACVMDLDLATFVREPENDYGLWTVFSLIAVPFFILCWCSDEFQEGLPKKLINFAKAVRGLYYQSGLAHTNILGSTLFGSISGSSVAASIAVEEA